MMQKSNSISTALSTVRRPDFMILGAMKSGTTTLHSYLSRHTSIFMCSPKEPMFFSREDIYARGLDWYFSLFQAAREDQVCGEASTCYSRWPHFGDVAARIHSAVPDAKFIYVMRHPVDRAYAHYRHEMQDRLVFRHEKAISLDEALETLPVIVETSLYRRQIDKFLNYFPSDRFLLLFFEDLTRNPGPVLAMAQRFLGLEQEDTLHEPKVVANPFGRVKRKSDALRRLDAIARLPGFALVKKLIPARSRASLRSSLESGLMAAASAWTGSNALAEQLSPLSDDVRKRLLRHFSAPNRELEQLMGRHVPSSWHE